MEKENGKYVEGMHASIWFYILTPEFFNARVTLTSWNTFCEVGKLYRRQWCSKLLSTRTVCKESSVLIQLNIECGCADRFSTQW